MFHNRHNFVIKGKKMSVREMAQDDPSAQRVGHTQAWQACAHTHTPCTPGPPRRAQPVNLARVGHTPGSGPAPQSQLPGHVLGMAGSSLAIIPSQISCSSSCLPASNCSPLDRGCFLPSTHTQDERGRRINRGQGSTGLAMQIAPLFFGALGHWSPTPGLPQVCPRVSCGLWRD